MVRLPLTMPERTMGLRLPLTCSGEEAVRYTGLSPTMFDAMREAGVIVPLYRDHYSYKMLDRAVEKMEQGAADRARMKTTKGKEQGTRDATKRRKTGTESDGPSHGETAEYLRLHRGGA